MSYRNLSILFVCQLISATGSIVLITLGGIIGSTLSDNKALATLPVSLMVVSVAATTIPAALLMRRIGRKAGFALASLSAALSMVLATYALFTASFTWFVAAAAAFGINLAFTQQYRFAAAESVAPAFAGRAISLVLLGAIGGAIVMQGQSVSHYLSAFILLGVGWNFLYIGGTTMLTLTYAINERFKAQAVNDFSVFGTSATASLLAGTVIHAQGWYTLVIVPLPLLLLCLTSLFLVRGDRLLHRPASQPA